MYAFRMIVCVSIECGISFHLVLHSTDCLRNLPPTRCSIFAHFYYYTIVREIGRRSAHTFRPLCGVLIDPIAFWHEYCRCCCQLVDNLQFTKTMSGGSVLVVLFVLPARVCTIATLCRGLCFVLEPTTRPSRNFL